MGKNRAVGIDLGTTMSAVAWVQDNGRTAMVRNAEGDLLTPSVVLFEEEEIIVGKEARKAGIAQSDRLADYVKRDMGRPTYSRAIRGEYLPPEVIQACILKKLKADAVKAVGPDMQVVITVPAFFDEPRRTATANAGEMAGLKVLDIVNEPTAAALAFGEELGYLTTAGDPKSPMKILVYDLGGGTFDVTLLDLRPGDLRTMATDGDVMLGGRDWDLRLTDHIAERFQREHGYDPRENTADKLRLIEEAENVKHALSARNQTTARVSFRGQSSQIEVTREQFEQLTADLIERTGHTVRQLLATANIAWPDISRILLVGGSTRMPMVAKMLNRLSGLQPDRSVNPDEAVARGAATFAAYRIAKEDEHGQQPDFQVTDVNAHSLGVEGLDPQTDRKRNIILIPRNSPLPAKAHERFATKTEGQHSIVVQVLEGESLNPSDCATIGRTVIRDLPENLPKNWPVEVVYSYGTNGRLKVRAKVVGVDREVKLDLQRARGMSDDRLAKWKTVVVSGAGFTAFDKMLDDILGIESPAVDMPPEASTDATAPRSAPAAPTVPSSTADIAPASAFHAEDDDDVDGDDDDTDASADESTDADADHPAPAASARAAARPKHGLSLIANLLGYVIASALGLAIGYYILCLIQPDRDFLNLFKDTP